MSRSVVISRSVTPTGDAVGTTCSTDRHSVSCTSCATPVQPTTQGQPSLCHGVVGACGAGVSDVGAAGIDMSAISCADISCADMPCEVALPVCMQGLVDVVTENTNSKKCIAANTRRRDRIFVPFILQA